MIQYVCDVCGRVKKPGEQWILGIAAETVGITTARREVDILSAWTDSQSVHPLAVHFCSDRCKNKYMDAILREGDVA